MRTIIKRLRARGEGDEGFTLIELLVVLLIIGILLAIAIPTYLSVTSGAKKSAAQSNLNTALTAAKAYFTNNNGTYPTGTTGSTALQTSLNKAGTSLAYTTGSTTKDSNISFDSVGGTELVLATSDGTKCYAVADVESPSSASGAIALASGTVTAGTYWETLTVGSGTSGTTVAGCTAADMAAAGAWTTSPTTSG